MGYYMGDYYSHMRRRGMYRGDYYRGDPGFFSALGGLFKKGIGAAVGMIPGVGPIAQSVIGKIGGGATKAAIVPTMKGAIGKIGGAIKKHPVLSAAGAAGATAGLAGLGGAALERHLLGGGRKRRRMNVYNPRALRRAVRRSLGFAKMARKVMFISKKFKHPKRWGHMGHFPRKRKK